MPVFFYLTILVAVVWAFCGTVYIGVHLARRRGDRRERRRSID